MRISCLISHCTTVFMFSLLFLQILDPASYVTMLLVGILKYFITNYPFALCCNKNFVVEIMSSIENDEIEDFFPSIPGRMML